MKNLFFTLIVLMTSFSSQAQNNVIQGKVYWDTLANNAFMGSFKVWLITHDSAAGSLTAVDSQTIVGYNPSYSFINHPAGIYRTKAAPMPGTVGSTYLVPTYHDSSLYWNAAQIIQHAGGFSPANIWMLQGTPTTGPGFIGGSIIGGANKGTGAGIPGIFVGLKTANGATVKHTYTDVNGNFSFSSLPLGTYTVFPEALNYITNEANNLSLTAAQYSLAAVNFKQTPTHIKLIPAGTNDLPSAKLFTMYPNPADGTIQIRFTTAYAGKASISITDMAGRQVMVRDTKDNEQIEVSHLPAGTYLVRMSDGKANHTEKIVITH
jgi:hypothetical protein